MNIRFFNAKILVLNEDEKFEIVQGELWTKDNLIYYIGNGEDKPEALSWEREIDAKGNLLMPGFKDAHTHTAMTVLRSFADDLPLQSWLYDSVFPRENIYFLNPQFVCKKLKA